MIGEPRTIARIVELLHLPLQHAPESLREVYGEISSSCGYDNFIRTPDGARLESVAGERSSISRLSFSKDRIFFQEEQGGPSLEHLLRRMEAALSVIVGRVQIPLLICRNITQRAVASLPADTHSSNFLRDRVFRIEPESFEAMGRPTQLLGMRLQCPPREASEANHRIRLESYLRDPGAIFIEDIGTWKLPIQSLDHARLAGEVRDVDTFVNEKLHSFLARLGGGPGAGS